MTRSMRAFDVRCIVDATHIDIHACRAAGQSQRAYVLEVLVALTLGFSPSLSLADLHRTIDDLTRSIKRADGRISYVYVRLTS
jgi:hypothetical protein